MINKAKIDQTLRPDEVDELLKSSFRTTVLFELMAEVDGFLTIGDISTSMDIPQSSASALVKSLLDTGYLQKDPREKTYQLSARLAFLGASSIRSFPDLPDLIRDIKTLKNTIGETIIIAMRSGIHSLYVYVDRISGQKIDEHVVLGSMRPLLCSATGRAMLLTNDETELGKLVRATCAEVDDPYWVETARQAPEAIEQARQVGIAFSPGPSGSGTAGFAFPLRVKGILGPASVGVAANEKDLLEKKDLIISSFQSLKNKFNIP